jgi:transcriptional regulator with XRE-family HTH domain
MSRWEQKGSGSAGGDQSFGRCLERLLEVKGWSVPELAEKLNVGPSLVYQWRRNERTPQLHTTYIAQIAQHLELTAEEHAALQGSQVFSLRAPRAQVPLHHAARHHAAQAEMHRVLGYTPSADAVPGPPEEGGAPLTDMEFHHPRGSGVSHGVVRGWADMVQEALALIDQAPAPLDPQKNTLLISTFAQASWVQAERYNHTGQEVLRRACARGWQVCHVWRLTKEVRRTIGVVRMVLDMAGTGQYRVLYLPTYEMLQPAYDLLVVPGVGAMVYFSTEDGSGLDGALVLHEREQVDLLWAHFQQIAAQARPLLQVFLGEEEPLFAQTIAETYERSGGRALVKDGLSFVTEPASWSRENSAWAYRTGKTGSALAALIEHRQRHQAAFERHVRTYLYRDVCPMRAVHELVEAGRYMPTAMATAKSMLAAPLEDRIEHLENTIAVLRAHQHYELALIDTHEEQDTSLLPSRFWEVAGGMRVFTNMRVLDTYRRPVSAGVMIYEATVVGAFQQHFDDVWARISPRNKDKEYVLWWLERQLDHLRDTGVQGG